MGATTERISLKEERSTTFLQLLMQIGAVSALTASVSMVTGIEMVWVLCRLFCQCLKAAWRGRHDDNQVKELCTESYPEFDDLGFGWNVYQGHGQPGLRGGTGSGSGGPQGVGGTGVAPATTDTELGTGPNLLGLDPILEERDVDIRAVDGAEEAPLATAAEQLYTHAWEHSGQSRPYTRILVSGKEANISDAPPLNAPAGSHHTSLRSEMYRLQPSGPAPSPGTVYNPPGGNYILKSRPPSQSNYTWHSRGGSPSPTRLAMTPADFINVYGQPARQLYDDHDDRDNTGYYVL